MKNIPQHSVYLQDGSLCNFKKRIFKHATSLVACFEKVTDPRHKRGIRYSHVSLLFLVFAAMTCGATTLAESHIWALHNRKFLKRVFPFLYGIADPTTISYLFQKLTVAELADAYKQFLSRVGVTLGDVVSADGKTMRAVTGKDTIRHMLSLFTHVGYTTIGQIGVTQKENEIPALKRLLAEQPGIIAGTLLLADALHTNPDSATAIIDAQADYLLVVKGNQKQLFADILFSFTNPNFSLVEGARNTCTPQIDVAVSEHLDRKRSITTTVKTTTDASVIRYIAETHGWEKMQTIGVLHRQGIRVSKDGTPSPVDETIGMITSRKVTAQNMAELVRKHWCIENNLHWVKDVVFLEDRHTLRKGTAPQVMSFMRSMVISLMTVVNLQSISTALQNFATNQRLHYQFLRMTAVI